MAFPFGTGFALVFVTGDLAIETFEQAAVEERHLIEQRFRRLGIGELRFVPEDVMAEIILGLPALILAPAPLIHLGVERGEEQVLQDREVEIMALGVRCRRLVQQGGRACPH